MGDRARVGIFGNIYWRAIMVFPGESTRSGLPVQAIWLSVNGLASACQYFLNACQPLRKWLYVEEGGVYPDVSTGLDGEPGSVVRVFDYVQCIHATSAETQSVPSDAPVLLHNIPLPSSQGTRIPRFSLTLVIPLSLRPLCRQLSNLFRR